MALADSFGDLGKGMEPCRSSSNERRSTKLGK